MSELVLQGPDFTQNKDLFYYSKMPAVFAYINEIEKQIARLDKYKDPLAKRKIEAFNKLIDCLIEQFPSPEKLEENSVLNIIEAWNQQYGRLIATPRNPILDKLLFFRSQKTESSKFVEKLLSYESNDKLVSHLIPK